MNFKLSLFSNIGDSRPQQVQRTWAQLCEKFRNPQVREEKDGLLFSPATYRGNRRLQRNVIELSMLVLEIDGAWECRECHYRAPLVLFRNNRHQGDRCPACHKRDRRITESVISQIEYDGDAVTTSLRAALPCAWATYSTHSHRQVTSKNPLAEARYRIVIPLASPIPVSQFPQLWQWAVDRLQGGIPADPQDKDPNRCYYTPVKCRAAAPYECFIEEGEFLNWRAVLGVIPTGAQPTARPSTGMLRDALWSSHEERHEELCRLIKLRGKENGRGNYDARCIAHDGKGESGLCYFPSSGAVKCNRGCDYYDLLRAEGLSDRPLPSCERLANSKPETSGIHHSSFIIQHSVSAAKLHLVYSLLLAHFFELSAEDETAVRLTWHINPYGKQIVEYPDGARRPKEIKICSMPSLLEQLVACRELLRLGVDPSGVPGFYQRSELPAEPSRAGEVDQWSDDEYGPWRINLPQRTGLLVPYDNGTGYVIGIKVFRNARDTKPYLLSSRGLVAGAQAVVPREERAA